MRENFVVLINNNVLQVLPPQHLESATTQTTAEIITPQSSEVHEPEWSEVDIALGVATGIFVLGAFTLGVVWNNPHILHKLSKKDDDRSEEVSLERQHSLQ